MARSSVAKRLANCPGLIVQNVWGWGGAGWPDPRRARRPGALWLRDWRIVPDLFFKMCGVELGGLIHGELDNQELGGQEIVELSRTYFLKYVGRSWMDCLKGSSVARSSVGERLANCPGLFFFKCVGVSWMA